MFVSYLTCRSEVVYEAEKKRFVEKNDLVVELSVCIRSVERNDLVVELSVCI